VPGAGPSRERLRALTTELMLIPGLSGHEGRVRKRLAAEMAGLGLATATDRLGNLIATAEGDPNRASVMLFAHMDQLGFVVRKIEPSGFLRLERLGGVPERALAAQELLICVGEGRDIPAVVGNKSHHATSPEEKYRVVPYQEILVDAGFSSARAALSAGVKVGSPIVYAPRAFTLAEDKIAGASVIAAGQNKKIGPFSVDAVPAYNMKRGPAEGKLFHDKGRGVGYIVTYGGKRFYFSGDTEAIPEMKALKNIDVAFVCMNLPYTMPPDEAADAVKAFHPKIVIPYHFHGSDLAVFQKGLEGTGIEVRVLDWYPK